MSGIELHRPRKALAALFLVAVVVSASILFPLSGCSKASDGGLQEAVKIEPQDAVPYDESKTIESNKQTDISDAQTDTSPDTASDTSPDPASDTSPGTFAQHNDSPLVVRFLNVGQGDCALISCQGHHMMIDGGPPKSSQMVYSVLKSLNITQLDYIVITHTDSDHCGGVPAALNYASVGTCYCSSKVARTDAWDSVLKYLDAQGKEVEIPSVNQVFNLGDAKITILGPTENYQSDNDSSIVCRIDYGKTSFLFTGDIESAGENALLRRGASLKADVLKVSHHGSNKCSSETFLRQVNPTYAVISVGKNNYGHPGELVINRLTKLGTQIYRTDQDGHVVFTSDGTRLEVETTKGNISK